MKAHKQRRFFGIQAKLSLTYLMVILLVAGISIGFIVLFTDGFVTADTRSKLREDAQLVAEYHATASRQPNLFMSDVLESMYGKIVDNNFSILIYDSNGKYYDGRNLDYLKALAGADYQTAVLDRISARLGTDGSETLRLGTTRVMFYTQTIRAQGAPGLVYGYVVVCAQIPNLGMNSVAFALYLSAIFMASLFALVFAAVIAGSMSRDIKRLTRRAEQLAHRNFNADTVVIDSNDEVGELAGSLEYMARNIREYDLNQKIFLQNASHELRTPLMSIRGYVEGLKDGVFDDAGEACDLVLGQVGRLEKLVNDVMYLSKIESAEGTIRFERISVRDVIEESRSRVAGIVAAGEISVDVVRADDLYVYGDGDLLATAVTNLLSNCLRFAKKRITIEAFRNNGCCILRVADDGEGINSGDLPHMFDRFYKGKNGKHGLGLAIAKAICEQHRGSVRAYNKQTYPKIFGAETGAVFDVRIPLFKQERFRFRLKGDERPAQGRKERVE